MGYEWRERRSGNVLYRLVEFSSISRSVIVLLVLLVYRINANSKAGVEVLSIARLLETERSSFVKLSIQMSMRR